MSVVLEPIGLVESGRLEAEDDYWGDTTACIAIDERFGPDALLGLDDFSHVEILFYFHQAPAAKIVRGARHPRNNPQWPLVGIFAQRAKNHPNRIGSTICRIVRVESRRLWVSELDAVQGTPVLDIKPVMAEFLPREPVRQPQWARELMLQYWNRAEP